MDSYMPCTCGNYFSDNLNDHNEWCLKRQFGNVESGDEGNDSSGTYGCEVIQEHTPHTLEAQLLPPLLPGPTFPWLDNAAELARALYLPWEPQYAPIVDNNGDYEDGDVYLPWEPQYTPIVDNNGDEDRDDENRDDKNRDDKNRDNKDRDDKDRDAKDGDEDRDDDGDDNRDAEDEDAEDEDAEDEDDKDKDAKDRDNKDRDAKDRDAEDRDNEDKDDKGRDNEARDDGHHHSDATHDHHQNYAERRRYSILGEVTKAKHLSPVEPPPPPPPPPPPLPHPSAGGNLRTEHGTRWQETATWVPYGFRTELPPSRAAPYVPQASGTARSAYPTSNRVGMYSNHASPDLRHASPPDSNYGTFMRSPASSRVTNSVASNTFRTSSPAHMTNTLTPNTDATPMSSTTPVRPSRAQDPGSSSSTRITETYHCIVPGCDRYFTQSGHLYTHMICWHNDTAPAAPASTGDTVDSRPGGGSSVETVRATPPVVDRSRRHSTRSSTDKTLVSSAGGETRRVRATATPLLGGLPRQSALDVGSLFSFFAWGFSIAACFVGAMVVYIWYAGL
jgi:hypothetical protein